MTELMLAIGAWLVLALSMVWPVWLIREANTSMMRYKLWAYRDKIVRTSLDLDMSTSRYCIASLLGVAHFSIGNPYWISVFGIATIPKASRSAAAEHRRRQEEDLRSMTSEQRSAIKELEHEFAATIFACIVEHTLFGCLARVLVRCKMTLHRSEGQRPSSVRKKVDDGSSRLLGYGGTMISQPMPVGAT